MQRILQRKNSQRILCRQPDITLQVNARVLLNYLSVCLGVSINHPFYRLLAHKAI